MASLPLTARGDVTTMNPAAEVITGYQRHELVGQPYSMLFDNTQFYSPVLDTLEHGTEHVALEISFPVVTAPLNSVSLPVVFITRTVK